MGRNWSDEVVALAHFKLRQKRTIAMRILILLIFTSLSLALVSLDLAHAATPDDLVFRAGAATSNITPSIGANPTAKASKPQATHVHDELHARCLVLDDGQAKLAIVVCDLRHISAEVVAGAKQIIQQTTGIPPQCVLVSATHTHTSTGATLEEREGVPYYDYRAFLTRRIAESVLRIPIQQAKPLILMHDLPPDLRGEPLQS